MNEYKKNSLHFLLLFFFFYFVIVLNLSKADKFYFDSEAYWFFSFHFGTFSEFSFLNYYDALRGYSFPLFLWLIRSIAALLSLDEATFFFHVSAIIFVLTTSVLPFLLFRKITENNLSLLQLCAIFFLSYFFWGRYIKYPLTDFPTLLFFLTAFYFLICKRFVLSGLFFGIVINFRSAYILTFPVALLGYYFLNRKSKVDKDKNNLFSVALAILGFLIISIPQSYLNKKHFNSCSLIPLGVHDGDKSIYVSQLAWGLKMKKYETNVCLEDQDQKLIFINKEAKNRLANAKIKRFNSFTEYIKFSIKHPLVVVKSYLDHIYNGFDLWYNTPYVCFNGSPSKVFRFLNYNLIFLALLIFTRLLKNFFTSPDRKIVLFLMTLVSSLLPVIPIAVETRFFLSIHLLFIFTVASGMFSTLKEIKVTRVLICYILFLILAFYLSEQTFSSLVISKYN